MEQKNRSIFFLAISGWVLVLILMFSFISKGAWVAPTANPVAGDTGIAAPINISNSAQTKAGNLTLQGNVLLSPTANNASSFKITNASSATMLNIDSSTGAITLQGSAEGPALSLNSSSGSLGAVNVSGVLASIIGENAKLGIGAAPITDNLEVTGTAKTTGNITSNTGFCIGLDCITSWPTGGSGVPASGIVLSLSQNNAALIAGGFSEIPGAAITDNFMTPYFIYVKN